MNKSENTFRTSGLFPLVCACTALLGLSVRAETLVWTGAGSTDNFSDAANWEPAQQPASGDSLTFQGETRTSPVNDLDPDTVTFATILFANDGSTGKTASFTLSGNPLKVSTSIVGVQPSIALTETLNLEIIGTSNVSLKIGGSTDSVNRHNFIFNRKVSGPAAARLENSGQYSASLWFNGPIEGFKNYYRPNGGGNVYLLGANNAFEADGFRFNQGNLHIIDDTNLGPAKLFHSGQGLYSTAGTLFITPTNDVTIATKLGVISPSQDSNGLTIRNDTSGVCVTFTGEVFEGGTKDEKGTRLVVDGVGDGRFEGNFVPDRMAFTKNGSGTWTLGNEIGSCALTGLVTVASGKLRVDCTVPSRRVTVAANATLAGCGALGTAEIPSRVEFASGAKYELGVRTDGTVGGLSVAGPVSLAANLPVDLPSGVTLAPGSRTRLMSYVGRTGSGAFTPGAGFPDKVVFTATDTTLYAEVPTESYTWRAAENAIWDKETANWQGGKVFEDRVPVEFPDLEDPDARTVEIPASVSPLSLNVTASATHPYTFTGAGRVSGVSEMFFEGTATNVWSAPLQDINNLTVSAGALRLEGPVSGVTAFVKDGAGLELNGAFTDGSILVEQGGSFTQGVDSVIGGDAVFEFRGSAVELGQPNAFTGGFSVGWNKQAENGNPVSVANIRHSKALGDGGDVNINYNSRLNVYADVAETNRTLHIWGYNNNTQLQVYNGHTFDWAGDIVVHFYPQNEIMWANNNSVIHLGKQDGSSTFTFTANRGITLVSETKGGIHLHAQYRSNDSLSFRGLLYLHSTNNTWSKLGINTGTCIAMAPGVLAPDKPVSMLQQWNNVRYNATLDLNGFDQTIAALNVTDYNRNVQNVATITSATPATLTISNAADSVFSDLATFFVTEAVNLRKMGAAKWTLGCNNSSTGHIEVVEGTLALDAAASMPVGAKSKLTLGEAALLEVADGVAAEIAYAERHVGAKTLALAPGLYGGSDCTAAEAKKVDWISGTGTLRVFRQENAGVTIIFR